MVGLRVRSGVGLALGLGFLLVCENLVRKQHQFVVTHQCVPDQTGGKGDNNNKKHTRDEKNAF